MSAANTAYRRVPTSTSPPSSPSHAPSASSTSSAHENEQRKNRQERNKTVEAISNKLHALFWVVSAIITLYTTDILTTAFTSPEINSFYFTLSLVTFTINVTLLTYLTLYLPYIAKNTLPWEIYCPRVIPTITFFGTMTGGLWCKALWPVFGLLTPGILIVVGMGGLMSMHFIPFL